MKILIGDIDSSMNYNDISELIESINKFVRKGNKFIVATDKAISYVADTLALTDLEVEYYICNDGAVIFDRYYNVLYRKDLDQTVVRPVIDMLESDDNILEAFIDTSHGFVKDTSKCANGIVARPFDKLKAEILLNKITLKYPNIHGHVNDNWINIIDIDVNKCAAIEYLEENYRLKQSEIYVLGVDINDLELMEKYNGYTINTSIDDIKRYSKGEVKNLKDLVDYLIKEDTEESNDLYEVETIY